MRLFGFRPQSSGTLFCNKSVLFRSLLSIYGLRLGLPLTSAITDQSLCLAQLSLQNYATVLSRSDACFRLKFRPNIPRFPRRRPPNINSPSLPFSPPHLNPSVPACFGGFPPALSACAKVQAASMRFGLCFAVLGGAVSGALLLWRAASLARCMSGALLVWRATSLERCLSGALCLWRAVWLARCFSGALCLCFSCALLVWRGAALAPPSGCPPHSAAPWPGSQRRRPWFFARRDCLVLEETVAMIPTCNGGAISSKKQLAIRVGSRPRVPCRRTRRPAPTGTESLGSSTSGPGLREFC